MLQKKIIAGIAVLLLLLVSLVIVYQTHHADSAKIEAILSKVDQDPNNYVSQDISISAKQQAEFLAGFMRKYFQPWSALQQSADFYQSVAEQLHFSFQQSLAQPGWAVNFQHLDKKFINNLLANADLAHFPNMKQAGIMVNTSDVRAMPTLLPSFHDPHLAGEGYPFDNWQVSEVALGYPINIIHRSVDGLWYLIATSSYVGWVQSRYVAFAPEAFQQQWRAHPFLVSSQDNIPLYNEQGISIAAMQIGALYPQQATADGRHQLLIPIKDKQANAGLISLETADPAVQLFPLALSSKAIAKVLRVFMGTPYGWGGLYGQRDCSATIQDVYAVFGIWLPRNSSQQVAGENVVALTGLSEAEKLQVIHRAALPFFTIIHFPGHVGIYLGKKDGRDYLLHDNWGVKTRNLWGKEGRIIIGRTIISPLAFPLGFYNVQASLLKKADSLSSLLPRS